MKPIMVVLALGLAVTMSLLSGCETLTGEGPIDEDAGSIERNIMDRLNRDDATRNKGLGVRVENGVATLYGTVPNEEVRARALDVVKGAAGVTDVQDELKVLSFSSFE